MSSNYTDANGLNNDLTKNQIRTVSYKIPFIVSLYYSLFIAISDFTNRVLVPDIKLWTLTQIFEQRWCWTFLFSSKNRALKDVPFTNRTEVNVLIVPSLVYSHQKNKGRQTKYTYHILCLLMVIVFVLFYVVIVVSTKFPMTLFWNCKIILLVLT